MKKRDSYTVRISGLGEGNHAFSFGLDSSFFGSFEHSEIENGNVQARILLVKDPGVMELRFELDGEVEVICDRCLEPLMTAVHFTEVIYIKEGEIPDQETDHVIFIGRDEHEIDVAHLLYEFTVLALPIRRIHGDGPQGKSGCDPGMLEKLNAHGARRTGKTENSDPRWDALKGIFEKNE